MVNTNYVTYTIVLHTYTCVRLGYVYL